MGGSLEEEMLRRAVPIFVVRNDSKSGKPPATGCCPIGSGEYDGLCADRITIQIA